MPPFPRPSTLRITHPPGQTLALAFLILVGLIALLEGLAHLPWIEQHIPTAVGSSHENIDFKFGDLDYLLHRDGRIDCIIVGSSMVRRGFDPLVFAEAYQAQTGQPITCYNFGISGAWTSNLSKLSQILVRRYHPRLLILGFSLRELTTHSEQPDNLAAPWLQYQMGSFNLDGWLVDHSRALRSFLAVRSWTAPDFVNPLGNLEDPLRLGYAPATVSQAVLPARPQKYAFTRSQWEGLERFLALRNDTQLLLVEMPASDALTAMIRGGRETYAAFIQQVVDFAAAQGVPAWTTIDLALIPDDVWADDYHMFPPGAEIFSAWLGERIGAAVQNGDLVMGAS